MGQPALSPPPIIKFLSTPNWFEIAVQAPRPGVVQLRIELFEASRAPGDAVLVTDSLAARVQVLD
jgi:hypothetical protein